MSVRNGRGELCTERQGIVDAFAEPYENLFSTKQEDPGQGKRKGCKTEDVPLVKEEEVTRQLRKMSRRKAARRGRSGCRNAEGWGGQDGDHHHRGFR